MKAVKILILNLLLILLFSCGMRVQDSSFTAQLDKCDNLINQIQYDDAAKLLAKIEKKSYSPFQYIGITKRYVRINDYISAQRVMARAYKYHSKSVEVMAVYSWLLTKNQEYDLAVKVSEKLQGTSYAGIYSEASFNKANRDNYLDLSSDFQKQYLEAYRTSGIEKFLINAAVYECYNGNYDEAFQLHPQKFEYKDNAEFWALVAYDDGYYIQAIADADFLFNQGNKGKAFLIKADSYLKMNEVNLAKTEWENAVNENSSIDPNILINCTLASMQTGNIEKAYYFIQQAVENFPDNLPSLELYGKFALNDNFPKAEDSLTTELRNRGIKSIDMVYLDSKPKIPISDALYRLNESFKRTNNIENRIEFLKLSWASNPEITKEQMIIDVWKLIEQNSGIIHTENDKLSDFVISFFIKQKKYEEASSMLNSLLKEKYQSSEYLAIMNDMTCNEKIFTSYLLIKDGYYTSAEKLLQSCMESDEKFTSDFYFNLGNLLESKGETRKAIEIYSKGSGYTLNNKRKSEFFYRIANIYFNENDMKNAVLHLDYALTVNPSHVNARLLQKKIKQ